MEASGVAIAAPSGAGRRVEAPGLACCAARRSVFLAGKMRRERGATHLLPPERNWHKANKLLSEIPAARSSAARISKTILINAA